MTAISHEPPPSQYRDRIRAAVVVVEANSILLVSYCFNGETFWALPGGAPRSGESPRMAAARELSEETGIQSADTELFLVSDHTYRSGIGIDSGGPGGLYHELGFYFIARQHSGRLVIGDEPEHGHRQVIVDARFIELQELPSLLFYPSHVVQPILQAAQSDGPLLLRYVEDRSLRDWIAPVRQY